MTDREAIDSLTTCRELMLFDPMHGDAITPEDLNADNKSLYDACGVAITALRERMDSGWVSVEDRLPETMDSVIVCGHNSFDQTSVFTAFRAVDEMAGCVDWFTMTLGYMQQLYNVVNGWTITHWRPLPALPDSTKV